MNLALFNFLEDNLTRIENEIFKACLITSSQFSVLSENELRKSSGHLVDGYIDFLVTGTTDSLDKLFKYLSRLIILKGVRHSDVISMPLILSAVVRRMLGDEYKGDSDQDNFEKFTSMLDVTETTAHKAALRFLEIFDDYFDKNRKVDDSSISNANSL